MANATTAKTRPKTATRKTTRRPAKPRKFGAEWFPCDEEDA